MAQLTQSASMAKEAAAHVGIAIATMCWSVPARAVARRLSPYLATSVNWREPNRRGSLACQAWCNREDLRCSRKTISMAPSTFVLLSKIDLESLAISVKRLALSE